MPLIMWPNPETCDMFSGGLLHCDNCVGCSLANGYTDLGRAAEALNIYANLIRTFIAKFGDRDDNIAVVLGLKAKAYVVLKKYTEALDNYEKVRASTVLW